MATDVSVELAASGPLGADSEAEVVVSDTLEVEEVSDVVVSLVEVDSTAD